METEFQTRKRQLLDECSVPAELFAQVMPRLERFMEPFLSCLVRTEQRAHAITFVQGLLGDLERKNVESIAYRFGQKRMPLQWFIGVSDWDDEPLREELVRQVGQELGEEDGVIVFDPSGFPKSGRSSVGVTRQWCGRLGKVENCQVAVYMGYVSRREQALVDVRLYLPREWAEDRKRRRKAGVPSKLRYRSRHRLCLQMLEQHGEKLPHSWIVGDEELGRAAWFRRRLHRQGERYLLAVACNTLVRDMESDPPAYSGRGRKPKRRWIRADQWVAALSDHCWKKIDVRDGSKGPLLVEAAKCRVVARSAKRQPGHPEVLVVIRYRDRDQQEVVKTDYYLSNASAETTAAEFARVAKAEHRIEQCIQRAKSETGLDDYEVRNWKGWHHHQTLSLIATWFLVTEALRGKKIHPGNYRSAASPGDSHDSSPPLPMRYALADHPAARRALAAERTCPPVSLETT